MAALFGLPKRDSGAHITRFGQAHSRHKGIIECVERQCWNRNALHVWFGRGAAPVILSVFEAMERGGEDIVKSIKVAGR